MGIISPLARSTTGGNAQGMKHKSQSRSARGASLPRPRQQNASRTGGAPSSSIELASVFGQALALHQAGQLPQAEALYRRILERDPDHFDSRHLLGIAHHQRGDHAEAVRHMDAALKINPRSVSAYNNRGVALEKLKRLVEALASYDQAIALNGDDAETFYNRGNVLKQLKRYDEALASYEQAIVLKGDYAGAFYNRGNALAALRRLDEAVASYDRAIALALDHAQAWHNRGVALAELRRHDEAIASYRQAIALDPGYAEAFCNRGNALGELKRFDEALADYDRAIALNAAYANAFHGRGVALAELGHYDRALGEYDRAIALDPDHADAFWNRGNALVGLKRFKEALAAYDQAIVLKPDHVEAFINRGIVLAELKRFEEALTSYNRAIALAQEQARAFYNRGNALRELMRFDEALADYDRAIALKPDYADAFNNRGAALAEQGQYDQALASYEKVSTLAPDHKFAFSGLADCAMRLCDWALCEKLSGELHRQVTERQSIISPFVLLGYNDDAALHLSCTQNYVAERFGVSPQPIVAPCAVRRNQNIRIAYLSSDFRRHAVAYLAAELFERHDRSRFEVIGVSFGPDDGSDLRSRLVAAFDRFIDVTELSDQDAAQLINNLQIDIAVDLNGHTREGRFGILASRPAAIQVSYLGFPATTGAQFIDYIIADPIVLPFDQQPYYIEHIVHLPDCFQVNDSTRELRKPTQSRREAGLPEHGFVFCCFNNTYKIRPPVFDIWMRIMRAIEGAVLWLNADHPAVEHNLRLEAGSRGVDPTRLIFAPRVDLDQHLARQRLADLFLDTLPVNAGATASAALWAGLPVLTCRGQTFFGRMGASLMTAVGLPEMVTSNLEEYEALALKLALDRSLQKSMRGKLEVNRSTHPLFDTDRFRRHIEAAYTRMWEYRQRGESPRSFSVEPLPAGTRRA
jgi:protein O-GlcNAc transferase